VRGNYSNGIATISFLEEIKIEVYNINKKYNG
jgi:hypothetical protein